LKTIVWSLDTLASRSSRAPSSNWIDPSPEIVPVIVSVLPLKTSNQAGIGSADISEGVDAG